MKNRKFKVITTIALSTTMLFGLASCDFNPNMLQPSNSATQDMTSEETDMFNYLNTNSAPVTGVQIIESSDATEDIQIYTNELLDVENVISGAVTKVKENNLDLNTHILVLTPKNSVEVSVAEWDELQERVHKFIDVSNIFAKQIVSSSYAYQPAVVDQNGQNSFGEVPVITFIANDYRVNEDFAMEVWERFVHTDVVLKSGNITFQYNHTGVKNTPEEMKDMVKVANNAANIIEESRMNYRITTFAYGSETAYRSTDYYNDINVTFLLNSNGETSTENIDKIKSSLTNLVNNSAITLGILNEK